MVTCKCTIVHAGTYMYKAFMVWEWLKHLNLYETHCLIYTNEMKFSYSTIFANTKKKTNKKCILEGARPKYHHDDDDLIEQRY